MVTIQSLIGKTLVRIADALVRASSRIDPKPEVEEAPLPQDPITPEAASMLAPKPAYIAPPAKVDAPLAGSVAARVAMARRRF